MPLEHPQPDQLIADTVRSKLSSFADRPDEELHALAGSTPSELSMERPHEVYTLGLDQLDSGPDLNSARTGGWRYMLQRDDRAVASAETGVDAGGEPVFAQFNSGPFVDSTAEALDRAEQFAGAAGGESLEPRLLHVPALHAMALWLHGSGGAGDVVLPLKPTPPAVDPDREYSVEDYLGALREAASTVDAVGPDDVTGG